MNTSKAYEKKLQAQLDEWNADIDKLKARADGMEADVQIDYNKKVDQLVTMHEAIKTKLEKLKVEGDDAWEDLKSGIEHAKGSLTDALQSAVSRFK